jgi:Kef-type K+ transport system membrane component KefB
MLDHELGVLAIAAAALNDIAGWLLLGVVSALATASFASGRSLAQLAGVLGFALLCWFLLRPAAAALLRKYPVVDGEIPPSMMAIVLIAVFILGMCTSSLGIFTIFGGFATGLLLHHDRAFAEAWRRQIGSFVMVFFLPIFFTATGLRTNLLGLTSATDWIWLGVFLGTGILGKIIPVYIAGRIAGYDGASALMLGGLMNTRALMELIVLNIGLETGFLPPKVFTMLVIMAVVTTITTGPFLRALMPRLGIVITRRIEA